MTDQVVKDYRDAMTDAASRAEQHPEERDGWAIAVFMGHAAGFLTEFKGDHQGLMRVRRPAHEKLLGFMANSPDSTALETVRKGLAILREEYEGVLAELPDLQWDHAMVSDMERIANENPIVSETVAAETLRYAGIEV